MQQQIDITKILADRLKAAGTAKGGSAHLSQKEWALKYTPHYFFRGMCPLHDTLAQVGDDLKNDRNAKVLGGPNSGGGGGKRVLVIAPRGHAKSTWCSLAIPLRAICEGTERYIILVADTAGQAEAYLKSIASELDTNEDIRRDYPLACQHGETWNTERKETGNDVCIEALGKGNKARGRKFRQFRPSLIIVDDPQNGEDMLSATTRAKDVEWFNRELEPMGDKETNMFVVGTMLHRECLVGDIETRPSYQVVKFAAIIDWPTALDTLWQEWVKLYHTDAKACRDFYAKNTEALNEGARVLWPEKESLLELMTLREEIGHQAFASEKQNDPRDPSKCEFPSDWFEDVMVKDFPTHTKRITVGFLDPALGLQTKKHDYPAIIVLHYLPELNKCLVECDMRKRPVNQRVDDVIEWHKIVRFTAFGVESVGFQQLVGQELMIKAPLLPTLLVENTGQHKNTRISRLGIWLQRKFFLFKSGDPSTNILLQQLKDHPHSAHDDGPDAMEGALRVLTMMIDPSENAINNVDAGGYFDDGLGGNIFGSGGVQW